MVKVYAFCPNVDADLETLVVDFVAENGDWKVGK